MLILLRNEVAEWDAALQTLRPCAACGRLVEWSAEDDAAAVTCQGCADRGPAAVADPLAALQARVAVLEALLTGTRPIVANGCSNPCVDIRAAVKQQRAKGGA